MNKNQKTITVVTDEENPIAVELVADAIISISESIKKLNNTRLNRRALLLLIADNCDPVKRGYTRTPISPKTIEKVLESIESLKKAYIKDATKK